jgi:hypothetical protein
VARGKRKEERGKRKEERGKRKVILLAALSRPCFCGFSSF